MLNSNPLAARPLIAFRSAAFAPLVGVAWVLGTACSPAVPTAPQTAPLAVASSAAPAPVSPLGTVVISVVGTNDLHGRIDRLPVLAGHMANLRRVRQAAGGGVVLVDAGDMFQGTLESNLGEGEAVIRAYNAIGYAAATLGNHEFDYGPAGPASTPRSAEDDPRGALAERAKQARFPLLTANIVTPSGTPLSLPGGGASTLVEVAGVKVGIIGVSTMDTLTTTAGANVSDLRMEPIVPTIEREAARLRSSARADLIVVAAHAGGGCEKLADPKDASSCAEEEIMQVARALPAGMVDVMVGGHTHAAIAHEVNGIAVVESWSQGRAFSRVDVTVDLSTRRVVTRAILPPRELCSREAKPGAPCLPGDYEGAPVVADAAVESGFAQDLARAETVRARPLGVTVDTELKRQHGAESPLGNLLADLMREARPGTDLAVINGGGIRADLPAGPMTYGALYSVFPFDNRFARVRLRASVVKQILGANAAAGGGFLSISGLRVIARCKGTSLELELRRDSGKRVRDDEELTVLASDFLASGGDGAFKSAGVETSAFELERDPPIRDALAEVLTHRAGRIRAEDLLPPGKPRVVLPSQRPVRCGEPLPSPPEKHK